MEIAKSKIVLSLAPGIMQPRKGGSWTLQLAKRMEKVAQFLIVGADASEVRQERNIHIYPKINDAKEVAKLYTLADVFLLCSERETFSMTCAEALCCGTPVAGFRCGAPETVFEEPYARFVEYGNLDELEKAVRRQLFYLWDREEVSRTNMKKYSRKVMYEKYRGVYEAMK